MLTSPTSLLQRWSDYRAGVPCADALVTAYLDSERAVQPAGLDLAAVDAAGWRSQAGREMYLATGRELVDWCIRHGRYVHNVAIHQDVNWDVDGDAICTPTAPGSSDGKDTAGNRHRWREWLGAKTRAALPTASLGSRTIQHRIRGELPCWSMVVRELTDGDLLVIDAPLCIERDPERASTEFFICDYSPILRQSHDVRVPMRVSRDTAREVHSAIGVSTAWHPFCRALAIVRHEARRDLLQVLQFQFRSPIPDDRRYTHRPVWPESVLIEARPEQWLLKHKEVDWLGGFLAKAMQSTATPASSPPPLTTGARSELRKRLETLAPDTRFALTRAAASPYEGVEAFWCCLASVLPVWHDDFPLTANHRDTLLGIFDSTFDAQWRLAASQLEQVVDLRYTPAVMDAIRTTLAHLPAA
jgi:hypothetical protein